MDRNNTVFFKEKTVGEFPAVLQFYKKTRPKKCTKRKILTEVHHRGRKEGKNKRDIQ